MGLNAPRGSSPSAESEACLPHVTPRPFHWPEAESIDNGLSVSIDHSMLRRTITVNHRWCKFVFHTVPICERHDVLDRGTRWGARKGCPAHRIDLELI